MNLPQRKQQAPQQSTPQAGGIVRQEFGATHMEARSETSVQAAEAEAMVKARCIMARSNPRDPFVVREKVLKDCQRPLFADKAIWSKPVGREDIEGPSVRFAEALARHMGNLDVNATIAEDTYDRRRIRVYAMDLESNTTVSADVVISKTIERKDAKDREVVGQRTNSYGQTVYVVLATEDELLNKTNSAVSKMRRNKIIELVPADLVEEAMAVCNATLAQEDAKDPAAARKKMVDAFLALGVPAKELVAFVGHPLDVLSPKELEQLRRAHNSIRDGEATWAAIVEAKAAQQAAAPKAPAAAPAPSQAVVNAAPAAPAPVQAASAPVPPAVQDLVDEEEREKQAAIERLRVLDEAEKVRAAAAAAAAAKVAPTTDTPPQGQLGLAAQPEVLSTPDLMAKMRALAEDPGSTVEQLMKLAKLADGRSPEDRKYLGQVTMEVRKAITTRRKS